MIKLRVAAVLAVMLSCITAHADYPAADIAAASQPEVRNNWGAKMKASGFHLGVDLQTKYVWRGMEMLTSNSAPVLFPQVNYQFEGLYVYAMGGYALNGTYAEVDLGVSYTWKWLTVGINDYYYPTVNSPADRYFNFRNADTGHWLEGVITVAPENLPFHVTVSNFFYGADKTPEGKRAYSTYVELGTYYDFLDSNRLALNVGAACNKSCYNAYSTGFSVCNVELKYTYSLTFRNGWTLPLNVAYIINPFREKGFINFSTSFMF